LNTSILIGRDDELKYLETKFKNLKQGFGSSIFIGASTGTGKTQLVKEFKLYVQFSKSLFFTSQCFQQGTSPYKPMIDILRQVLAISSKDELDKYGNILVKIFPELQEKGFEALENFERISEKLRLFDTVVDWLKDVSKRETLVIFIDNIHLIDQASVELLNTCIRDLKKSKIMFLATFIDDEITETYPLWQTIEEGLTSLITLKPFSTEDIQSLIKIMLGNIQLNLDFVEKIKRITGANVFFISEVIKYLVEEDILQIRFGVWHLPTDLSLLKLPISIEDIIKRRLESLSSNAKDLLKILSVLGKKLSLALFKVLSNLNDDEIFNAIDELIERQFLNNLEEEYFFTHDKVRELLYSSLEEDLKTILHQKIAETIELENIENIRFMAGELSYHYIRGLDKKKAVKYLLMAGFSSPIKLESSKFLKLAVDILEKLEDELTETILITYLYEICERDEKEFIRLKELAQNNIDKNFIIEQIRKKLAWITYMIAPDICLETSEKIILSLESKGFGIETTAEFESIRASSYAIIGQIDKSFSITDPIINNEKYNNTLVKALMLFGRLNGLLITGRFRQLVKDMEEVVYIFENNFDKLNSNLIWSYGFSLFIREYALAWLGEFIADNKYLDTLKEIAKKYNYLDLEFWNNYPNIVHWSLTGDYNKIKDKQEELVKMIKRMDKPIQYENKFNTCVSFAHIQNGKLLEAKSITEKIIKLATLSKNNQQEANGFILEGLIMLEENKFSLAIKCFKKAISLSVNDDESLKNDQAIPALYYLSEAYLKNYEIEKALEFIEKAFELANSEYYENSYHLVNIYRLLGEIYANKNNYEEAHEFFAKSSQIAKEKKLTIQEAFIQVSIGHIWLERKKFNLTRIAWQKAILKFREVNNEYQANKIILKLNSIPKPLLIETKKEKISSYLKNSISPEFASEIGYKLMDLFSSLGIIEDDKQKAENEKLETLEEDKILSDKLNKVNKVELLNDLGKMILSNLDTNTILNKIMDKIIEVIETDRAFLMILNSHGELQSQIVRTKNYNSVCENKIFIDGVIKTGKAIWAKDVICIPLKDFDKVIALIYIDKKSDKKSEINEFTEDDLNLLESMANFANIAIIKNRLFEQTKEENEKVQILKQFSKLLSSVFTRKELLYKVLDFLIKITGAEFAYFLMGDEFTCEASLDKDSNKDIEVKINKSVIKKVQDTEESVFFVDTNKISNQASIVALDIVSLMCVPLISNSKIIGVLYVSSKTFIKSFTQKELSILEDIIFQTVLAIENLSFLELQKKQEQVKQEFEIVKDIQKSILSFETPEFENIEISGASISANELASDYYDYIQLDNDRFAIAFGDITAHGVSTGVLIAMVKACLYVQCKTDPNVISVMQTLNEMIFKFKKERSLRMGFVYSIFDLKENTLTISSAGQALPYYYKHELRDLETIKLLPSYQLGMKENLKLKENKIKLSYKDVLVYFTNGIVNAKNFDGEEYTYKRLEEFIKANSFLSSKGLRDAIFEDCKNWIGQDSEMNEDLTIIVIKVKPHPEQKLGQFKKD